MLEPKLCDLCVKPRVAVYLEVPSTVLLTEVIIEKNIPFGGSFKGPR